VLLADSLGFSAKDTAAALQTSTAAVNSALQRARATLAAQRSANLAEARQETPDEAAVLARYVDAWEAGDVPALLALLREDCVMVMPPYPVWVVGPNDIGRVLTDYPLHDGRVWRLVPAPAANGTPAFGFYRLDEVWTGWGIQVLGVELGTVRHIHVFKTPHLLPAFGLPLTMPRPSS
jgi:RNA polymerase sigma-70 factor (ECF subfamily)